VLFTPAFLFVFPAIVPGFPSLSVNAAIGLALFVELFGYSSSVGAYWYRHQIDFNVATTLLAVTVPTECHSVAQPSRSATPVYRWPRPRQIGWIFSISAGWKVHPSRRDPITGSKR
jgi:hypothetical protein